MSDSRVPDGSDVVMRMFEEGKSFTEELLKENERLRMLVSRLKAEKRDMEKQYIQVDVPRLQERVRLLDEELRLLREENHDLKEQFRSVEEQNREFAARYVNVEVQNSHLINLYVAIQQLHSKIRFTDVLTTVKEIFINMVGTEHFAIYRVNRTAGELQLIGQFGMDDEPTTARRLGDDVVGEVIRRGTPHVMPDGEPGERDGDPIAVIPMKVDGEVVAVAVIYELLVQKDGFGPSDHELFELLGSHAGVALTLARPDEDRPGEADSEPRR